MDKTPNKDTNVLLSFKFTGEPNDAQVTAIKIDGSRMEFKSFGGFTAIDIYNLLFGEEKNDGV